MFDRTEQHLGLKPKRLAADTATGPADFLRLAGRPQDCTAHPGPRCQRARRWHIIAQRLSLGSAAGYLHLPMTRSQPARCTKAKRFAVFASKFDCDVCVLKMQCCPNSPSRQIPRDVHEYARDVTRRLMRTKAFLKSRDQRKRVEMRFAHLEEFITASSACGCEVFRAHAMSSSLPPPCRNLKTLALRMLGPPPARRRAFCA